MLTASRCVEILQEAQLSHHCSTCNQPEAKYGGETLAQNALDTTYEHELEWFLIGKATVQAYGIILDALLNQAIPLGDDLWYWDSILGNYRYLGLYLMQTSPFRLWNWSRSIYHEVKQRSSPVAQGWTEFYGLVKNVVRDRSIADVQRRVASPLTLIQTEVRRKRAHLQRARMANANGIGYLLSNTFNTDRSVLMFSFAVLQRIIFMNLVTRSSRLA